VPAKKTLSLWKVPDILVVHLKRFSGGSRRDKIDNLIVRSSFLVPLYLSFGLASA
jgi:ubiquitin C-terminal hydrolase